MRIRGLLSASAFVCVLAASAGRAPVRAQAAPTCCPPMPVVATSQHPAAGHVHLELQNTDLEAIFSNRHIMFNGGWDDAFAAFSHELDPTGRLGLAQARTPPLVRHVGLIEGGLTDALLHPTARRAPLRNANRWANTTDPRIVMTAILNTLARINKYGEPAGGLRAAALAGGRFLVDGLNAVPVQAVEPAAMALRGAADAARSTVSGVLGVVAPELIARQGLKPPPADADELPLDRFDIANAALDLFDSVDEHGARSGITTLRHDGMELQIFDALVHVAAAAGNFGGTAPPGSAQDAVACRAFAVLLKMADVRTRGSEVLRAHLLDEYGIELPRAGTAAASPPRLALLRAALIMAGVADANEARMLGEHVLSIGLAADQMDRQSPTRTETMTTLKGLIDSEGGAARPTYRGDIARAVNARFDEMEKRHDAGTGSAEEDEFVKAWKAGGSGVRLVGLTAACGAAPGQSKGTVYLYALTAAGLQSIRQPVLGVPMLLELQFDPPSGDATVDVDVAIGGATKKMTLQRYDDKGYIYRSEPFVPTAGRAAGSVFDPGAKPKGGGQ